MRTLLLLIAAILSSLALARISANLDSALAGVGTVAATVETEPVPSVGDAADDPAIWIHPTAPAQSLIIGTDKKGGGLAVYDLTGQELQYLADGEMNNVDLRYNFQLGQQKVTLVTAGNETSDSIAIYQVNSATRQLEPIAGPTIHVGIAVYGSCMYHSPTTGKYYFFATSQDGEVEQWELFADGAGQISGSLVRTFNVGSQAEGCVADDELAYFYISQESTGIWKYGAEPEDGTARTLVDTTDASGHLEADVEGLTLYYTSDGGGYLIASSQGSDNYVIYQRQGNNAYVTTFEIVEGNGIDAVSNTDGIDVTNFPLDCATFPQGALVVHDGKNDTGNLNQNYKLVPWQEVAGTVSPPLAIDTAWDPRQVGARGIFLSLIFYLPLVTTSSISTGPC